MLRLFTKSALTRMSSTSTLENVRFLSQTSRMYEKSSASSTPTESQSPQTPASQASTNTAQPAQPWEKTTKYTNVTGFDKRVLVSVGKYKSIAEVPDKVPYVDYKRENIHLK